MKLHLRISFTVLLINALGGALTAFYLQTVLPHLTEGALQGIVTRLFFGGALTLALSSEFWHTLVLGKVYNQTDNAAQTEGQKEPSRQLQWKALNLPALIAFGSWLHWLIAGIVFALLLLPLLPATARAGVFWQVLLSDIVFSGTTAGILIYFAAERLWQKKIPLFFPQGNIHSLPAFHLTLTQRFGVVFILGLMPMLLMAGISYTKAQQIAAAANPAPLLRNFNILLVFIVSAGLLTAVILAFTLGSSLIDHLHQLAAAMKQVSQGNTEYTLPVSSADELGQLAQDFNLMAAKLQQEDTIRNLFERYLSPQVADHLLNNHSYVAPAPSLATVTVLFVDIRRFTAMSEQLTAAELASLLNRFFREMTQCVENAGGLVNKFIGDSLMVVFGSPLNPDLQASAKALQSAQCMLQQVKQVQRPDGSGALEIGVGIATGRVFAGNIGGSKRIEYTFIGDAVNLASRLQGMTKVAHTPLLFDAETAARVPDSPLHSLGALEIRGKQQPVEVFTLPELKPPTQRGDPLKQWLSYGVKWIKKM